MIETNVIDELKEITIGIEKEMFTKIGLLILDNKEKLRTKHIELQGKILGWADKVKDKDFNEYFNITKQ